MRDVIQSPSDEPITQRELLSRIASLQELMNEKLDHIETKVEAIKESAELAYPNRDEYTALERRVGKTENIQSELSGKASQSQVTEVQTNVRSLARMTMGGLAFSALAIIVTVVLFFARKG